VDSTGATIDFLLAARRDAAAAKRFFRNALRAPRHPRTRVINVDGNPSYPKVVAELKQDGKLGRRCRWRTCPYAVTDAGTPTGACGAGNVWSANNSTRIFISK